MHIDYPYHVGSRGRTATTGDDDHIRDLIEQLLFTSPGERVNRPEFGCGLRRLAFEPTSPEIAAALQFTILGALQRWLANIIAPELVEVTSDDATLRITVVYTVRRNGERRRESFSSPGGAR